MALRDQPYIPLYVMDFQTDERLANCSAESTGVYIRLMCILHKMTEYGVITLKPKEKSTESPILNFALKVSRQMPYDVDCIAKSLAELVEEGVLTLEGDDRLYQRRMVKDNAISEARAEAGRKGGLRAQAIIEDLLKQNTEQVPEICPSKPEEAPAPRKESQVEERFEIFWSAYPKKQGKGAARKSWAKIAPSKDLFDKIMSALEAAKQCEQWRKDKGQFIPYPATWLNQERWDDDYGVPDMKARRNPDFDPDNPYADWGEEGG